MISPIASGQIPDIIYPSKREMEMMLTEAQKSKLFSLSFAKRSELSMWNFADRKSVDREELSEAEYRGRAYARNLAAIGAK